jgi:hypothetical protein
MSSFPNDSSKLAFTSQCLPGSLAEQQEKERLEEFHRQKALRKAEEERNSAQRRAEREKRYEEDCAANQKRMQRSKTVYTRSPRYDSP